MKFTLKPYQRDAVEQVLDNLDRAKVAFHRDDEVSSFSLTATTGAGRGERHYGALAAASTGRRPRMRNPKAAAMKNISTP